MRLCMTKSSEARKQRWFNREGIPRKGTPFRRLALDLSESPKPNHYLHATKGYKKISPARQALHAKVAFAQANKKLCMQMQ